MKSLAISSFLVASLSFQLLPTAKAAEIIWVSGFDTEFGQEYFDMLEMEGHNVTEMVVMDPNTDQQAQMNAADLVVVSRKVNSGDFPAASWNDTITSPLILMSSYISRSNRWAWFDADGLVDATPAQVMANDATHPVWNGIPLTNGNSDAWHFAVDNQTSFATDPVVNGGTLIASSGTSVVVAEWPEGAVAVGPRMLFNAGSRENTGAPIGEAGKFNITSNGQIALLNAIHYYTGSPGEPHLYAPGNMDLGDLSSEAGAMEFSIPVLNFGGESAVSISNVTISGPGVDHFTLVSAPESIEAGGSGEILMSFDTLDETGSFLIDLVLENDSELESIRSRTVAISARAINLDGPQLHLTFDETEGETLFDITGHGRHATTFGAVGLGEPSLIGDDGNSIRFSGGAGVAADVTTLPSLENFTLSMWLSADGGVAGPQTVFAKGPEAASSPIFALLLDGQNFAWFVDSEPVFATGDNPLPIGEVQHLVAVYDSEGPEALTLYLNGSSIATASDLPPFSDVGANFLYFGSLEGNIPFPGAMDDVQLYDRALSDEDVQALFNSPGSINESETPAPEITSVVWISELGSEAGSEFLDLLNANDLPVTELFISNPTAADQALLNAADVIVVSRKANSGTFNNQTWDTTITTPLIVMSPYLTRAANWGWFGAGDLIDDAASEITADAPAHRIFEGIDIAGGVSAPWHTLEGRGTSLTTNPVINGGTLIASAAGNPVVAEWPAETVAVGPRMLFSAGARELDGATIGDAGAFNLTPEGEIAFLNALSYMRNLSDVTPPVESAGSIDIVRIANGVRLTLEPEKTFSIEYSESLAPPVWTEIATDITDQFDDTDPERTARDTGFYRGVEQQ